VVVSAGSSSSDGDVREGDCDDDGGGGGGGDFRKIREFHQGSVWYDVVYGDRNDFEE